MNFLLFYSLPDDIIDKILLYSYNIYNKTLLNDNNNFYFSKNLIIQKYIILYNDEFYKYWLVNDLYLFFNNLMNINNGYNNYFYNKLLRLYYLNSNNDVDLFINKFKKKNIDTQINILLAILKPYERDLFKNQFFD